MVEITQDGFTGRAESVPYRRYGETVEGVLESIQGMAGPIETGGLERAALQSLMPAGAARNAIDCALWDLDAKRAGRRAWELAALEEPSAATTAYTISLDEAPAMAAAARREGHRPLLKLKLDASDVVSRVQAVREAAPDATLVVDANEAWTMDILRQVAEPLASLGVAMIEQPLPAGNDSALGEFNGPIPVCADESCHVTADLPALEGRYAMVNIKLDKTGGLTEALRLREVALNSGFRFMVGCMIGTSLAMAPAMLVATGADFVDLDAPLLLAEDRNPPLTYLGSRVFPPDAGLWG